MIPSCNPWVLKQCIPFKMYLHHIKNVLCSVQTFRKALLSAVLFLAIFWKIKHGEGVHGGDGGDYCTKIWFVLGNCISQKTGGRSVTDQKGTSSYWFSPAHSDIVSVLTLGAKDSALWEKLVLVGEEFWQRYAQMKRELVGRILSHDLVWEGFWEELSPELRTQR